MTRFTKTLLLVLCIVMGVVAGVLLFITACTAGTYHEPMEAPVPITRVSQN